MTKSGERSKALPWSARQNDAYETTLNALAQASLAPDGEASRQELGEWMGLDGINFAYFLTRWRAFREAATTPSIPLDDGTSTEKSRAYSTATLPKKFRSVLPVVDHSSLETETNLKRGREAGLWVKKMMAGTGSSLDRRQYLADRRELPLEAVELGAKGTDLFVSLSDGHEVSLAELQWLRSILSVERGDFGRVYLHDIVGSETEVPIQNLWGKPSPLRPKLSYDQWVEGHEKVQRTGASFQAHLPTVCEDGKLTYRRHAPGGHGLFGLEELWIAAKGEAPADQPVSVIGNGEDLSSQPDPAMVGWMVASEIPIAMVTTTKTEVDRKGGQIAVVVPEEGAPYVTIVEVAQAEAAGQGDLFQELGLREGDDEALFNTNMALFNHRALGPRLQQLFGELGEDGFLRALSPDLIRNPKKQRDADGVERTYLQLEGAMGSVLLNLDRVWRERVGEPLVHFINVPAAKRTQFFSPIKTPFDFFLQFFSDRFRFDETQMTVVDQCPGQPLSVSLTGSPSHPKHYGELTQVLRGFEGARVRDLRRLKVEGCARLVGVELRGEVEIHVPGDGQADVGVELAGQVPTADGRPVLENVRVEMGETPRLVPLRN